MPATGTETAPTLRDPVCGMTVDADGDGPRHTHAGRSFRFCSAGCRDRFAAAPGDYLTAVDPVCGMTVAAVEGTPSLVHEGETVWFCCDGCRAAFAAQHQHAVGSD